MSDGWKWTLAIGVAIVAFATKPSLSDFQKEADSIFSQARSNAFGNGDILTGIGMLGADYAKTGKYNDYILFSTYKVSVGGAEFLTCYGVFGKAMCGSAK